MFSKYVPGVLRRKENVLFSKNVPGLLKRQKNMKLKKKYLGGGGRGSCPIPTPEEVKKTIGYTF